MVPSVPTTPVTPAPVVPSVTPAPVTPAPVVPSVTPAPVTPAEPTKLVVPQQSVSSEDVNVAGMKDSDKESMATVQQSLPNTGDSNSALSVVGILVAALGLSGLMYKGRHEK